MERSRSPDQCSAGNYSRLNSSVALGPWFGISPRVAEHGMLSVMDPKQIVHSDPEILGGTPVFVGTRVPVQALLDFLEGGDTIEEFLDNYPGVSREQAVAFLEEAGRALVAKIA
jgi:uncharacterized protein (DUF433 family)